MTLKLKKYFFKERKSNNVTMPSACYHAFLCVWNTHSNQSYTGWWGRWVKGQITDPRLESRMTQAEGK